MGGWRIGTRDWQANALQLTLTRLPFAVYMRGCLDARKLKLGRPRDSRVSNIPLIRVRVPNRD